MYILYANWNNFIKEMPFCVRCKTKIKVCTEKVVGNQSEGWKGKAKKNSIGKCNFKNKPHKFLSKNTTHSFLSCWLEGTPTFIYIGACRRSDSESIWLCIICNVPCSRTFFSISVVISVARASTFSFSSLCFSCILVSISHNIWFTWNKDINHIFGQKYLWTGQWEQLYNILGNEYFVIYQRYPQHLEWKQ